MRLYDAGDMFIKAGAVSNKELFFMMEAFQIVCAEDGEEQAISENVYVRHVLPPKVKKKMFLHLHESINFNGLYIHNCDCLLHGGSVSNSVCNGW